MNKLQKLTGESILDAVNRIAKPCTWVEDTKRKHDFYDLLAVRIGYNNSKHMDSNSSDLDKQTKILFNYLCETEELPIYFHYINN